MIIQRILTYIGLLAFGAGLAFPLLAAQPKAVAAPSVSAIANACSVSGKARCTCIAERLVSIGHPAPAFVFEYFEIPIREKKADDKVAKEVDEYQRQHPLGGRFVDAPPLLSTMILSRGKADDERNRLAVRMGGADQYHALEAAISSAESYCDPEGSDNPINSRPMEVGGPMSPLFIKNSPCHVVANKPTDVYRGDWQDRRTEQEMYARYNHGETSQPRAIRVNGGTDGYTSGLMGNIDNETYVAFVAGGHIVGLGYVRNNDLDIVSGQCPRPIYSPGFAH